MNDLTYVAHGLDWLISEFVSTVPGVAHVVVVSSDGLPLVVSSAVPVDRAEQLAAIVSGLVSLTQGAARVFESGTVTQTVVDMQQGVMLTMSIDEGACLAVLVARDCDMALVAYHMTLLADRAGHALTPAVRAHLRTGQT